MSWMKRPQAGAAPPQAEPQPQAYAAAQPFGNQQSMYPNYQGAPAAAPQQQTWQVPQQQPQYSQQYSQIYQQQPFVSNSNQFFQQPQQYNQNYTNQNFDNVQQGYQQNYYHNQTPQQQNFTQNESSDTWEDNWGWGWEESSKQQKTGNQLPTNQPPPQALAANNANVIEESFTPTQSWNWSMEDKKESESNLPVQNVQNQENNLEASNVANHNRGTVSEPILQQSVSNIPAQDNSNEVKNLSDKDVVKEHLPNLALGKRFHIENLTPQWSIESQMSQDSSDGPLTQSEGTYRSENQSRNSSKSSPGPNTDTSNFNYSLSGFNEMTVTNTEISKHSDDSIASNILNNNRRESYDELANSVKDMSIKNHENTAVGANHHVNNSETIREHKQPLMPPLPSVSPAASVSNQFIPQQPPMPGPPSISHMSQTSSAPALPSLSNTMHPVQTISPPMNLPPPPSMIAPSNLPPPGMGPPTHLPPPSVGPPTSMPPPPTGPPTSMPPSLSALSHPPLTNFPPSSSHNPFKSASPFTHKNIPKIPPPNPQPQAFPTQMPSASLTSPAVVTQILQQDRLSTFGANLETTPDNSERPDQPQMPNYRSMPISQQIPDNLEVAPQNDRNEYLQTAHLSSGDYGENTDFSRNIPPTGLRRMGVGQQEVEYSQGLNISGDEPPPGLARMVPGQQTEVDSSYDQGGDDEYMDRQIDGQPMDNSSRPYRQADGQQTPDYTQGSTNRGSDRRPIGLDRMVPGEPSNEEYPQYQTSNFGGTNEHRIVTGVDHDYPIPTDAGPPDIREQNVDGSDYTEPTPRNPSRSVIGVREASNATSPDFSLSVDDQQREITMEGENLQDLSSVSAVDFSREAPYNGSNTNIAEATKDRHDVADPAEYPMSNSRKQSLNCATSGEDSGRDRAFKASPRKDRDTNKSSKDRDRDRERDKDRGRYSRGDRKYDRESERRPGRDERRSEATRRERDYERDRRERDDSPGARRHRRSARSRRYETEDTDYYSDRERERRQHREGSYTSSKPPRDTRDERGEHRRRTADPDRRYDDDRPRRSERHRDRDRDRDRFEHRYRDIDPRKYASLRRNKDYKDDDERRKGEAYSSGSRAGSREATATDEEAEEPRRRAHRDQRRRHRYHHYYEGYDAAAAAAAGAVGAGAGRAGWDEALEAQRRQYEYYERLRRSDPAAYMRLYKQLLTPGLYAHGVYGDGYGQTGYEARAEERGSVHSGRSSANGLKPTDTYYGRRDAASMRTDFSDRELTTDMSLNLHLEESTVRSERMTPFKYSTAHVKGSLSARALVVVRAGYPVDGRAPALSVLPLAQLLQRDPQAAELAAYPGPLLKGVTHKKSVVEYCTRRAADAAGAGADAAGHALLWELLALLLRQNGVVVGSDIAELLMKNTKEFDYKVASSRNTESCGSPQPGALEDEEGEIEVSSPPLHCTLAETTPVEAEPAVDEREALERFREYLIYGNRQEALEWAMRCGLWGHALQLAAHGERRARAAVCARFVASLRAADPLHSLYAALAHRTPPAATCVSDERWGDWRPHAAIILANASSKPEQDRRTLTQLGDSLCARGLAWSAQFCYVSAGVPFGAHPLAPLQRTPPAPVAPPRLALLLADSRAASLPRFASNQAIFATEIYEYALSLSQDYVLDELTVYKLMMGTRLADVGQCERALRYAELAARAVTRNPGYYSAALVTSIASLADRLKYYDPALQDDTGEDGTAADSVAGDGGDGSEEASPRHQQWLRDVHELAHRLSAQASLQNTPQHGAEPVPATNDQYGWADQTLQQQHVSQQYADPIQDSTDYPHYQQQQHYQPQAQDMEQQYQPEQQYQHEQQYQPDQQYQQEQQYSGYEEPAPQYGVDPYWQGDNHYGYHDQSGAAGGEAPRPTITMPGAAPAKPAMFADGGDERPPSADQTDRETDTPKPNKKPDSKSGDAKGEDKRGRGGGGGGWLGGLFTKLSLRAPNQMILPDDTNPSIVWDEEHKRWRDTDAAEGEAPAPPAPPPVLPAMPAMSTSTPLQSPGAPPTSNIFKMQKGRHIKNSYVDVLNPGGAARAAPAPLAPPAPLVAPLTAPQNYFIPAPLPPADQTGMYDPTQMATHGDDFRSGI